MSIECLSVGVLVADHLCAPIPHFPVPGELVLASDLPLAIGGCAANVGIDLAKLGIHAEVVGAVGRDSFGRFIVDTLRSAGAGVAGILESTAEPTSGTLIINVAGEDRRFIHCMGANATFRASDIPFDLVKQSKVLYLGGYLLMPALDARELAEVFGQARSAGVTTVLDIVLPGPGDHAASLAPVLAHTDYFLPNTDEAGIITRESDPIRQAEFFRAAGAKTVAITCGGEGTVLLSEKLRLRAGSYQVPFVGGTGAGDAFDAGFIAGLLAGEDVRKCLEWGSVLGASCVRAVGATEGVFTRDEAIDFMREKRLEIESI